MFNVKGKATCESCANNDRCGYAKCFFQIEFEYITPALFCENYKKKGRTKKKC